VTEVSRQIAGLSRAETAAAADPLTDAVELSNYDLYVGDGHYIDI
jgi:hypothetical protein